MKKKQKKIKYLNLLIGLLIICLFFFIFISNRTIYKIENRTNNIKEEKKKDIKTIKTIGWVRVQGTNIDTPIITYSASFDPFTETEEKTDFAFNAESDEILYNKVNILGHNILNLSSHPRRSGKRFSRFDGLMAFVYIDFAKKNKYIQYTIDGKNYLYKIYAVRLYESYDNVETEIKKKYTEKEIVKYANKIRKDSLYKYNVEITGKDNLISLITCTRFFGSRKESAFVVDARMVRKGEKAKNYTVKETDNYKKIKKILKGDEDNEV